MLYLILQNLFGCYFSLNSSVVADWMISIWQISETGGKKSNQFRFIQRDFVIHSRPMVNDIFHISHTNIGPNIDTIF